MSLMQGSHTMQHSKAPCLSSASPCLLNRLPPACCSHLSKRRPFHSTGWRRFRQSNVKRNASIAELFGDIDPPKIVWEDPPEQEIEGLEERVVHVTRVAKTVKGGRNISFRATVVVGNRRGSVGVGNSSAKEIGTAVTRAIANAKKSIIKVPLDSKAFTFPHRADVHFGASKVMLRPAADGTGVVAGGSVRVVLEMAGVRNGFGKILGSSSPMNNAKAALHALKSMRTIQEVAKERGVTVGFLRGREPGPPIPDDESGDTSTSPETQENTSVAEVQSTT